MLAKLPPMGFSTWNTFGGDINENLIREIIDVIADGCFGKAGYEYVIIDDCWAERERGADRQLYASRTKFPSGIKALSDYAHSKGLKFGLYSCAGVRTCCGYPGSFDHEYEDARRFASWGVDYLKYDFCNFPTKADNLHRYLTMSMALRASGREIMFAGCNWGRNDPSGWMRSIGVHTYRSDTDIRDNFSSCADIIRNQHSNLNGNAPGCWNDLDMLTVGMNGNGHAAVGNHMTPEEYELQFAFWCMVGSPLIIGCDVRNVDERSAKLLCHPGLLSISQDPGALPPYIVQGRYSDESCKEDTYILMKILDGGEFALGFFNLRDDGASVDCIFSDCGISCLNGMGVMLTDVLSGDKLGVFTDDIRIGVKAHGCRVLRGRIVYS